MKNDKVTVTSQSIENGYEWDIEQAKKLLKVGGIYTIDAQWEHDLHGTTMLKEFPGVKFNSITFVECV